MPDPGRVFLQSGHELSSTRKPVIVFAARIPLKTLAVLCKSLATMLHSGVALLKTLEIASRKTGNARCRQILADVRKEVQQGTDIAQALRDQNGYFPELMTDMVSVGEHAGALPEVLDGLAAHYENIVRLRRMLIGLITFPALQLIAAILVVALVIFILGIVGASAGQGQKPNDILGLGLMGTSGALIWLAMTFGSIFAVIAGYYLIATVFRKQRFLDGILMKVPVLGNCMRSFAIARFSWALALTQQTGMPISRSLELSFRATGNGAFVGASRDVCDSVLNGSELSQALDEARLFPEEYLSLVQVAEASGTVPETLERLSPQFEDQARRSLSALAVMLGWLVWSIVAVFIIFIIFSFVMKYVGMINAAANGNLDAF
ncbi:MAG TPA: type II secretion system F family protein [Planctomycetaceae bacterium]